MVSKFGKEDIYKELFLGVIYAAVSLKFSTTQLCSQCHTTLNDMSTQENYLRQVRSSTGMHVFKLSYFSICSQVQKRDGMTTLTCAMCMHAFYIFFLMKTEATQKGVVKNSPFSLLYSTPYKSLQQTCVFHLSECSFLCEFLLGLTRTYTQTARDNKP